MTGRTGEAAITGATVTGADRAWLVATRRVDRWVHLVVRGAAGEARR